MNLFPRAFGKRVFLFSPRYGWKASRVVCNEGLDKKTKFYVITIHCNPGWRRKVAQDSVMSFALAKPSTVYWIFFISGVNKTTKFCIGPIIFVRDTGKVLFCYLKH